MVRPGGACRRKLNTGFHCPVNYELCTSLHPVEAYEVASIGLCPFSDPESSEIFLEDIFHRFKLWPEYIRMSSHVLRHTVDILEETDVAELVYLVMSYGLVPELRLYVLQIVGAGGNGRKSASGEGDLRRALLHSASISIR